MTIIVTAQAIQDLPNGVLGSSRGRYDAGKDRILAERKVIAVLRRDAYWNKFNLLLYEYLDE